MKKGLQFLFGCALFLITCLSAFPVYAATGGIAITAVLLKPVFIRTNEYTGNRIQTGADFQIHGLRSVGGTDLRDFTLEDLHIYNGYIKFPINGELTDVFSTSTTGDPDQIGSVAFPDIIPQGDYQYIEVKTPVGFTTAVQDILIDIPGLDHTDGKVPFDVVIPSKPLSGNFTIQKTVNEVTGDFQVNDIQMDQFGFTLFAEEDILDPTDNSVLVKKGDKAKAYVPDGTGIFSIRELDEMKTDSQGLIHYAKIPLGKYILRETSHPDGIVTNTREYHVVIRQEQFHLKVDDPLVTETDYSVTIDSTVVSSEGVNTPFVVENEMTECHILVTDNHGDPLSGVEVKIEDDQGKDLSRWKSTESDYVVTGLTEGKEYTVMQTDCIPGYYYDVYQTFVASDKRTDIRFVDNPINYQFQLVDEEGNPIRGSTLELVDITDPKNPVKVDLPNHGMTSEIPIQMSQKLIAGHRYELSETDSSSGIYHASSTAFFVPLYGDGEMKTIVLEAERVSVSIRNIDNHGQMIGGSELELIEATEDKDGNIIPYVDSEGNENVIHQWKSNGDQEDISAYVYGSSDVTGDVWYIVREKKEPFGFYKAEDVSFKVTGSSHDPQFVDILNVRKNYFVSAVKVDAMDHTRLLKGAEITLFTKEDVPAVDLNGIRCIGLTDGLGVITWNVEYNGDISGYYVKETDAPTGYRINPNRYFVELSEDFRFAEDNAYKIVVNDYAASSSVVVNTGDPSFGITDVICLTSSLFILAAIIYFRLKASKE